MYKVHRSGLLVITNVTITAVGRVGRYVLSGNEGSFVFSKRPVGVTVESPNGSYDFAWEDCNPEAGLGLDWYNPFKVCTHDSTSVGPFA